MREPSRPALAKLLIDCDPGHDDAVAILYAARHCDVVGVTTVFGNQTVEKTTLNALRVLTLAGLSIPVAKGCGVPLVGEAPLAPDTHGASGLDGVDLPDPDRASLDRHAVEFIIETARDHRGELALAIIGAHTNVALALRLEPRLAEWLGGSPSWAAQPALETCARRPASISSRIPRRRTSSSQRAYPSLGLAMS